MKRRRTIYDHSWKSESHRKPASSTVYWLAPTTSRLPGERRIGTTVTRLVGYRKIFRTRKENVLYSALHGRQEMEENRDDFRSRTERDIFRIPDAALAFPRRSIQEASY